MDSKLVLWFEQTTARKTILKACRAIALTKWVVVSRQALLAEAFGINRAQITRWLSGETTPAKKRQAVITELASIWDAHCKLMKRARELTGGSND